jgi:hypothetical protein
MIELLQSLTRFAELGALALRITLLLRPGASRRESLA